MSGRDCTVNTLVLTAGGAQLSPYMQLTRKHYEEEHGHYNHDVRPFKIVDSEPQIVHPIEVEDGRVQLSIVSSSTARLLVAAIVPIMAAFPLLCLMPLVAEILNVSSTVRVDSRLRP